MLKFWPACRRRPTAIVARVRRVVRACLWARPVVGAHAAGTGGDLLRGRAHLLAENALLRQPPLVLRRSAKHPGVTAADRVLLVLQACRVRAWRQSLLLVQPETLLRRHRAGFRALWRHKSRPGLGRPPLAAETVALIRRLAADNPRWGAERIRGGLGKLGIRVAKRAIPSYPRGAASPCPPGQTWATFLRHHAGAIWACDFLPVSDLLFRPLYAFFVIAHGSRRVVHVGVTRHPTDAWVAQQLREATPVEERPRYLIRDNDDKFGKTFERVARASDIAVLRTPYRAPRANAVCERFLDSVRRECLDHILVLGERRLAYVLREYATYFNREWPHQGLGQAPPVPPPAAHQGRAGKVRDVPLPGGLHHAYHRAA